MSGILEKSEMGASGDRDVIGPGAGMGGVGEGGGVDSGEGAEFVGEVGLVVEAAVKSEICPGEIRTGMQLLDSPLEAKDAHPDFGGEADLFAEDLGEAALAPTGGQGDLADGSDAGRLAKARKREIDHGLAG